MKTMKIREFLRGGYKDITEITVITHHGAPIATWMPQRSMQPRAYELSYRLGVDQRMDDPKPGSPDRP